MKLKQFLGSKIVYSGTTLGTIILKDQWAVSTTWRNWTGALCRGHNRHGEIQIGGKHDWRLEEL